MPAAGGAMSIMAVLLYAGVTTLTAALVTLFTAGMAAGNVERRARKRRYRQLEVSRTERPLEGAASRRQPEASRAERPLEGSRTERQMEDASPEPETPAEVPAPAQQAEAAQGLPAPVSTTAAFAVQGTPPAAREKKQAERHAPSARGPAAPARREAPAPAPAAGQEAQTPRHRSLVPAKDTPRAAAPGKPSPAPADAAPAAAPDAMADLEKLLQELEMPTGGLAGDAPPEDGGGTLDIFAGMGEPEMAVAGLDNDLNGIDGGGLPAPARKSTPKSRR